MYQAPLCRRSPASATSGYFPSGRMSLAWLVWRSNHVEEIPLASPDIIGVSSGRDRRSGVRHYCAEYGWCERGVFSITIGLLVAMTIYALSLS